MAIEIALLPPDELSKAIFCGAITIEFMFLALRNYSSEIENEIDAEIWVHVRQFVDNLIGTTHPNTWLFMGKYFRETATPYEITLQILLFFRSASRVSYEHDIHLSGYEGWGSCERLTENAIRQ